MTSLFLVSSAIYTSYGKCSIEERIEQTKETIKSIRTYAPDSNIVLFIQVMIIVFLLLEI